MFTVCYELYRHLHPLQPATPPVDDAVDDGGPALAPQQQCHGRKYSLGADAASGVVLMLVAMLYARATGGMSSITTVHQHLNPAQILFITALAQWAVATTLAVVRGCEEKPSIAKT